jgi:hypothetical protein
MICPRRAHDTLDTVTTSPVPGVWDVLQRVRCLYTWRTTEPDRPSHEALRPVARGTRVDNSILPRRWLRCPEAPSQMARIARTRLPPPVSGVTSRRWARQRTMARPRPLSASAVIGRTRGGVVLPS